MPFIDDVQDYLNDPSDQEAKTRILRVLMEVAQAGTGEEHSALTRLIGDFSLTFKKRPEDTLAGGLLAAEEKDRTLMQPSITALIQILETEYQRQFAEFVADVQKFLKDPSNRKARASIITVLTKIVTDAENEAIEEGQKAGKLRVGADEMMPIALAKVNAALTRDFNFDLPESPDDIIFNHLFRLDGEEPLLDMLGFGPLMEVLKNRYQRQLLDKVSTYDIFFTLAVMRDIRAEWLKDEAQRNNLEILNNYYLLLAPKINSLLSGGDVTSIRLWFLLPDTQNVKTTLQTFVKSCRDLANDVLFKAISKYRENLFGIYTREHAFVQKCRAFDVDSLVDILSNGGQLIEGEENQLLVNKLLGTVRLLKGFQLHLSLAGNELNTVSLSLDNAIEKLIADFNQPVFQKYLTTVLTPLLKQTGNLLVLIQQATEHTRPESKEYTVLLKAKNLLDLLLRHVYSYRLSINTLLNAPPFARYHDSLQAMLQQCDDMLKADHDGPKLIVEHLETAFNREIQGVVNFAIERVRKASKGALSIFSDPRDAKLNAKLTALLQYRYRLVPAYSASSYIREALGAFQQREEVQQLVNAVELIENGRFARALTLDDAEHQPVALTKRSAAINH